jgi:hypothetical protein
MLLMTYPMNHTSHAFDGFRVALPDGRVTTVDAVLAEARRARGKAVNKAVASLPKLWRRIRLDLAALFAPALGRGRQLRYLP